MTTQAAVFWGIVTICITFTANTVIVVLAVRSLLRLALDKADDLTKSANVKLDKRVALDVNRCNDEGDNR